MICFVFFVASSFSTRLRWSWLDLHARETWWLLIFLSVTVTQFTEQLITHWFFFSGENCKDTKSSCLITDTFMKIRYNLFLNQFVFILITSWVFEINSFIQVHIVVAVVCIFYNLHLFLPPFLYIFLPSHRRLHSTKQQAHWNFCFVLLKEKRKERDV